MNELVAGDRPAGTLLTSLEEAGRTIGDCRDAALKAHHLSTAKLGVLRVLIKAGEPLPLGQLAERLTCVRSNVTQLVDRLEQEGMVKRLADARDRRCLRAMITEEGRRRYALGTRAERQVERRMLQRLTVQEQEQLRDMLARVVPP